MVKYVTLLFRRARMSREEFSRYWKNTHAPREGYLSAVR